MIFRRNERLRYPLVEEEEEEEEQEEEEDARHPLQGSSCTEFIHSFNHSFIHSVRLIPPPGQVRVRS